MFKNLSICLFVVFLYNFSFCQTIQGSNKIVTFTAGSQKPSELKLKNGETLHIRFKQFTVDVLVFNETTGQNLFSVVEDKNFEKLQACEFDFDSDGKQELVVIYGDITAINIMVYKKVKSEYILIGEMSGEEKCILTPNTITLPYGSQGLYSEYILKNNKFIETQN